MVAGYAMEPLDFCQSCHSPLPAQPAEIRANHTWYVSLDPASATPAGSVERLPERRADEGVTCALCHWRGGEILAPSVSGLAPHPVRATPELRSADFCMTCHDFQVATTRDGTTSFMASMMQATGQEWRAWGGEQTSRDCHMPSGRHRFTGGHDREALRKALSIERSGDDLVLTSVGVGHHLPSGDVFRHLTVEVADGDGWRTGLDVASTTSAGRTGTGARSWWWTRRFGPACHGG